MSASLARIQLLPAALISQIAAGEVIERPASVVKELIENSLDAGASQIEIDLQEGGVRLIRIKDDGCGIEPEDLRLALTPHATSKIWSLRDLEQVSTLGFRGEALASIGSISRLALASRVGGSETGWIVRTEGRREVSDPEPTPHPEGTTVEIRDLFFNTPARRKFLRSEQTESLQAQQVVRRMAFSRFDVGFRFIHNRRQVLNLKASPDEAGRLKRVRDLCGAAFLEKAVELDATAGTVQIWGWLGLPEIARAQTELQYLYVNGRMVRDKLVNHAIRMAYQDFVEAGKHPVFVLHLEINPTEVDVNVHPAKNEVRFRDSRMLHDFIYSAVHRVLARPVSLVSSLSMPLPAPPELREATEIYKMAPPTRKPVLEAAFFGQPLGVLKHGYLLAENARGLVVVDVKAAMQQLVFEQLRSAWKEGALASLPLLIPETLGLSERQIAVLMDHCGLLVSLGIELQCAGPGMLLIRQIPALLRAADRSRLVREVLEVLSTWEQGRSSEEQGEALLKVMASQASDWGTEGLETSSDNLNGFLRDLERWVLNGEPEPGLWRQLTTGDLARLLAEGKG